MMILENEKESRNYFKIECSNGIFLYSVVLSSMNGFSVVDESMKKNVCCFSDFCFFKFNFVLKHDFNHGKYRNE